MTDWEPGQFIRSALERWLARADQDRSHAGQPSIRHEEAALDRLCLSALLTVAF